MPTVFVRMEAEDQRTAKCYRPIVETLKKIRHRLAPLQLIFPIPYFLAQNAEVTKEVNDS